MFFQTLVVSPKQCAVVIRMNHSFQSRSTEGLSGCHCFPVAIHYCKLQSQTYHSASAWNYKEFIIVIFIPRFNML